MQPRSLFEGNIRVEALAVAPADINALSLTDLADGIRLSKALMRNGYRLSPTGSDSIDEPGLEETGNTGAYGASNYEVNLPLFRYLDEDGLPDEEQDIAYNLFTGKGVHVWLAERIGPPASKDWAAGDPYSLFPIIADDPQAPTDLTGYVKFVQPARVSGQVVLRGTVAANGG